MKFCLKFSGEKHEFYSFLHFILIDVQFEVTLSYLYLQNDLIRVLFRKQNLYL